MDDSTASRLGYASPHAPIPTTSSASALGASGEICSIPLNCTIYATVCREGEFSCLCYSTNNFGENEYFDSECIYLGCTSPNARKAFIQAYIQGCGIISKQLMNVPPKWQEYVEKSATTVTPTTVASAATMCTVPEKCQIQATSLAPRCQYDDLDCICRRSSSMQSNQYFNIDCVYDECPDPAAKREFMKRYTEACKSAGFELNAPRSWETWAPSTTTVPSMSTLALKFIGVPMPSDTLVTLRLQAKTDVVAVAQSATMSSTNSPPQATGLADQQIPICGISKQCMKRQDSGDFPCFADDFDCICIASNSLANNSQFNQQCAFDECKLDIGREEFIQNLSYHCRKVGHSLIDIPDRWAVYFPTTTPPPGGSLPTTTSTSNSTLPIAATTPSHLADGAVAGIVIGGLVALGALGALIFVLWRARKKSKELMRKNAILADRSSAYGASARIEHVMRDRASMQPQGLQPRSATSINTTDVETLIAGGGHGGYADVSHADGYERRGDEYYGKWHESDVGSSTLAHYGYQDGVSHGEGEYYGKYEESGTGTIDTYEQGVRDSYAEGRAKAQEQERGSYYGPDGVRKYGKGF